MSDTTYVDYTTPPVNAAWLNEINDHVWHDTPTMGTTVHGADKINFTQSGTGAVERSSQDKARESVSVEDFGADPTGVIDSYAAIQAAITAVSNLGGGVVKLNPNGLYKISAGLVSNKSVLLKSDNRSDISTNTNGGSYSTARATILYIGASAVPMFTLKPATVGDILWGGGSEGIEWNGNAVASYGVLLDNTRYSLFDGKVRDVTVSGVGVCSTSGAPGQISMKNHIRSLEFVWGVAAACRNANGLTIWGNTTTLPSTQQFVGDVSGLVYNGALVSIAETDNSQFQSIHGVVQSGGAGCSVSIAAAGAQASNNNVFQYVVGKVVLQSGLIGNVFHQYISEGGTIAQASGSSSWDGELADYVTGKRFKSHCYALRKKIHIPTGSFIGDAITSTAKLASVWSGIAFNSAGTGQVGAMIPPIYDMADGVIEGVEFFIGTNGTSNGNYRMTAYCSTINTATSFPIITPEKSVSITAAAPSQYTIQKYTFAFTPELAFSTGNMILLSLLRLGVDPLDTNTDDSILVGARILFRGAGPNSSGSGTYYIPEW